MKLALYNYVTGMTTYATKTSCNNQAIFTSHISSYLIWKELNWSGKQTLSVYFRSDKIRSNVVRSVSAIWMLLYIYPTRLPNTQRHQQLETGRFRSFSFSAKK